MLERAGRAVLGRASRRPRWRAGRPPARRRRPPSRRCREGGPLRLDHARRCEVERRSMTALPRQIGAPNARTASRRGSLPSTSSRSAASRTSLCPSSPRSDHQHRKAARFRSLSARSSPPAAAGRPSRRASVPESGSPGTPSVKPSRIQVILACSSAPRSSRDGFLPQPQYELAPTHFEPKFGGAQKPLHAMGRVTELGGTLEAATEIAVAPRCRARSEAASSSAATGSSGPITAAARCHTRRSGCSVNTSASAACAA